MTHAKTRGDAAVSVGRSRRIRPSGRVRIRSEPPVTRPRRTHPGPGRAAPITGVCTGRVPRPGPSATRPASAHAATHLDDDRLSALRAVQCSVVPIHGWLDDWCLGWARSSTGPGGPVWGWDGLVTGRTGGAADPARAGRGGCVPQQRATMVGRSYRAVFTEVMAAEFGIQVPPLRLTPGSGAPWRTSPGTSASTRGPISGWR